MVNNGGGLEARTRLISMVQVFPTWLDHPVRTVLVRFASSLVSLRLIRPVTSASARITSHSLKIPKFTGPDMTMWPCERSAAARSAPLSFLSTTNCYSGNAQGTCPLFPTLLSHVPPSVIQCSPILSPPSLSSIIEMRI